MYKIEFSPKFLRILKKIPKPVDLLIQDALKEIALSPRKGEKLVGQKDAYRYRVGKFRIIYKIIDHQLIVLVINFGHRKEIYRDL